MNLARKAARRIRRLLLPPGHHPHPPAGGAQAAAQISLKLTYQRMVAEGLPLPPIREVGFQACSQTDEDGILLFIFSVIGTTNKLAVEVCAGDGIECNTANLILNHGWSGLLVDGNEELVARGHAFYAAHPATYVYPPTFLHRWVTRGNVNSILQSAGFEGPIDLLVVDMDGVDYWIWDALRVVDPRVVVAEYQDIIGPQRALTVPYSDDFDAYEHPTSNGTPNFCGASLPAFVKLAESRGYRLIGCNRYGYNAFFVKDALAGDRLPGVPVEQCFTHPKVLAGMKERFPTVAHLPWVEV